MKKTTSKITYTVDFNFFESNGRIVPMNIKTGFTSYAKAEEWMQAHTTDGMISIWREI